MLGLALLAPTIAAGQACVGDCDGNGRVSVAELVLGVNIVLERRPPAECSAFTPDVASLVAGVGNSLHGCPSPPDPLVAERILSTVVPPLIDIIRVSTALPPTTQAEATVSCASAGTAAVSCGPLGDGVRWSVTFDSCSGGFAGEAAGALDGGLIVDSLAPCEEGPYELLSVSFDGTASSAGQVSAFDVYSAVVHGSTGRLSVGVSGSVTSDCLGGEVAIDAPIGVLFVEASDSCPTAGHLQVSTSGVFEPGLADRLTFGFDGIEVDAGSDGSVDATFDSCGDPRLARCP